MILDHPFSERLFSRTNGRFCARLVMNRFKKCVSELIPLNIFEIPCAEGSLSIANLSEYFVLLPVLKISETSSDNQFANSHSLKSILFRMI